MSSSQSTTESNGLGVAAFVIALIGFFVGGLLSPVGLILGCVALGRRPRGFAIAAVIIGGLGTCLGALVVVVVATVGLTALAVAMAAFAMSAEKIEVAVDMAAVAAEVSAHQSRTGAPPASLDELGLDPGVLTDPWNNQLRYALTEGTPGFDLTSLGPDGQADTEDDIVFSRIGEAFGVDDGVIEVTGDEDDGEIRIAGGEFELIIESSGESGRILMRRGETEWQVGEIQRDSGAVIPSAPAPAMPTPPSAPSDPTETPAGGAPDAEPDIPLGGG